MERQGRTPNLEITTTIVAPIGSTATEDIKTAWKVCFTMRTRLMASRPGRPSHEPWKPRKFGRKAKILRRTVSRDLLAYAKAAGSGEATERVEWKAIPVTS